MVREFFQERGRTVPTGPDHPFHDLHGLGTGDPLTFDGQAQDVQGTSEWHVQRPRGGAEVPVIGHESAADLHGQTK